MKSSRRSIAAAATVMMLMLLAVSTASAGWFWNARLDVGGTEVRLMWSVDDASQDAYRATIGFAYPGDVDVALEETLTNRERIHLTPSRRLRVTEEGTEVVATYRVIPLLGSDPGIVTVSVIADGTVVASATGEAGERIVVPAVLP